MLATFPRMYMSVSVHVFAGDGRTFLRGLLCGYCGLGLDGFTENPVVALVLVHPVVRGAVINLVPTTWARGVNSRQITK